MATIRLMASWRLPSNYRVILGSWQKRVVSILKDNPLFKTVEIAGSGFINLRIHSNYILNQLKSFDILNCKTQNPQTVVIDYSSPNLAKEMHVGHLRSSIIGDCLARVLAFKGYNVIIQNHVGDWGTQFGMLLAYMEKQHADNLNIKLSDLEQFYREAKQLFDSDNQFAETSRQYVVKLQSGDQKTLALWKKFVELSLKHVQQVYDKLNLLLQPDDVAGESNYNHDLPEIVNELMSSGIAVNDGGAKVVFIDEKPFIIQKQDGGYLYSTTDLCCLRYRVSQLKADRILYVVDNRQKLHFEQLFATAKMAGYLPDYVQAEFVGFGTMTDKTGKPFKTRTGGTIKLIDLLEEAEKRANNEIIGIGAVKYADLSKNRNSDYVFDFDSMLKLTGNTAPYLQYAYARIHQILKKTNCEYHDEIHIENEMQRQLCLCLLQFNDILDDVLKSNMPHYLCGYLYQLATIFSKFYEQDSISNSPSRLNITQLTGNVLQTGLELLGIETVEYM